MSEPKPLRKLDPQYRTCPQDARYHNQNMSRWCFATFVDYKKCIGLLGKGNECCLPFEKIYKSVCPNAWIARWEEQIVDGSFPVDLPKCKK